ncbi:hypothetical protein PN497_11945 [Sphaerospermopsis kisseleviana CS-549]|uniref:PAP fibrillin n=1 Tax=Sphaerospermopsis kisseleviana CS-549 TaxID=3021783 RepID=A0ABT4ZRP2_9CYAN|nr:hypothetical protein [Sphaerospermopsis kisseleviana]MDB9442066.1 hypothetical protein [Sphaerospermopsis kisseleviana CS-549]BAZ80735.1 hypothetical protein NIES73_19980 [Sphaerospermopsis kisseleviana NIES-73]
MTSDLTSTLTSDFLSIVSQTAAAYREGSKPPTAEVVVNALLQAEKTAKQQRLNYPFPSLIGKWRLCFATGTKKVRQRGGIILGKGFYVPKLVKIHISFSATTEDALVRGEIANQVQLGSILLKLTGLAKYLGKKNLLAFDFTQMQISLFNRVVYNQPIRSGKVESEDFYNQPIAKLPFFAFFLVTEDFIAARGRGGGLAIWVKEA